MVLSSKRDNPPLFNKKHSSSAGDKQGMTLSELIPLVRKAEMSRVEVQNLIDILLNKQQDAPVIEEWSEVKNSTLTNRS